MKIAILTFFGSGNYGGDLQAYALQKKLSVLGYDVEVINQLRPMNKNFKTSKNFKPIIELQDAVSRRNKLNSNLNRKINLFANFIFFRRYKLRTSRFRNFENNHINLTKKIFLNFDDLYRFDFPHDVFIVGSDQVWNYTNGFSPEPYFLTFVNDGRKKISYAASIGHSDLIPEIKSLYSEWIHNIDFVSTRELQAQEIVEGISEKKCTTVLDPTLLITRTEWLKYLPCETDFTEDYLLIYTLVESKYIFELAKKIAAEKNLKVVRIISKSWTREGLCGIKNIYDAGPIEFVNLFSKASFILTNSFHGTAFSVNLNVPFYTVTRRTKKNNSRFSSLLTQLDLQNRLLYEDDDFPSDFDLNYEETNIKLNRLRQESLKFLLTSIR